MKTSNINFKDRKEKTRFFEKIAPDIAQQMSKALEVLTAEKIKVEFSSIKTLKERKLLVDVIEKCFGSYTGFRSQQLSLEGIAVIAFPISSTKTLVELVLKRYLGNGSGEKMGHKIKLSAFKELTNILVSTYITGVAGALKDKIETSTPKFVYFHNIEILGHALSRDYNSEGWISVGQFIITPPVSRQNRKEFIRVHSSSPLPLIKGKVITIF